MFVIVFPSTTLSYFSSFSASSSFTVSSITYLISFPFTSYFFNPVNVCVQFSFSVTATSLIISPFAFNCNVMLVIAYAFAASLSVFFHTFVAVISIVSSCTLLGSNVFVIVFPSITLLYFSSFSASSSNVTFSSISYTISFPFSSYLFKFLNIYGI